MRTWAIPFMAYVLVTLTGRLGTFLTLTVCMAWYIHMPCALPSCVTGLWLVCWFPLPPPRPLSPLTGQAPSLPALHSACLPSSYPNSFFPLCHHHVPCTATTHSASHLSFLSLFLSPVLTTPHTGLGAGGSTCHCTHTLALLSIS